VCDELGKPPKDDDLGLLTVSHLLWLRHTTCSQDMASGFGHASQPRIVLHLFPKNILQAEGKTSLVDDVL